MNKNNQQSNIWRHTSTQKNELNMKYDIICAQNSIRRSADAWKFLYASTFCECDGLPSSGPLNCYWILLCVILQRYIELIKCQKNSIFYYVKVGDKAYFVGIVFPYLIQVYRSQNQKRIWLTFRQKRHKIVLRSVLFRVLIWRFHKYSQPEN